MRTGNLTATRAQSNSSEYEAIFGTNTMSSGRHYWEIKIDRFVEHHDIIMGIA